MVYVSGMLMQIFAVSQKGVRMARCRSFLQSHSWHTDGRGITCLQVQLPVKKPLACTFGGPDLDQLFVATRVEKGEGASEHWGSILSVRVPGVKGVDGGYLVST